MIWRWRLKSPAMITFSPSKSQSFAALRHFASPIKGPTNSNPQESLPSKSFRNREQLRQTPKNTFLSPQIVLATLQSCSSDIIALSYFLWCGNVKRILDELETVGCVRKPQIVAFNENLLVWSYTGGGITATRHDDGFGLPVSVNVWSILIDGFCKSGQIEVAAYLLEKMVEIGCSPNIVTCTSLIKGFLESRMPGKAFEILGTLESQGCFPDLVSLQYVLLPLLTSGLAIQPDLVVCNCLLSYFHKAGYPDGAVKFYNDMIDRGFLPDKYSFAGVLSALCRLDRTNEAFNVYQGIIRSYPGADAHIHTIMINELIKSGSFHKATRLFRKAAAEKLPLDVVSYNVAIHGLIRGGQMEEAFALFNQMKEMDVLPNKHSYNMILSGFCRKRNVNMVKHLLQEMVDGNIEMDYRTYKIVKNLPCESAYNLLLELRNLGLLPKVVQESLAYEHDTGAYTSFSSLNDAEDVLDFGTSSSDDVSDAVVSVG
ncbi:UNVERIFIED_CONTAM: Pentatricopeptide repeat-containing protein [Sesamum radiatum]|uniref:Pentatricopeptide repeat-containing protein n=1 Tax=Sesamum radiatum TaxID=300843 RepID=A0AAW2PFR0_SESRA